jgi:hypothetical protein
VTLPFSRMMDKPGKVHAAFGRESRHSRLALGLRHRRRR